MLLRLIQHHTAVGRCKRYYAYGIILFSFLMILQPYESFFLINNNEAVLLLRNMEVNSSSSVSDITESRRIVLSSQCNHSNTSLSDIRNCSSACWTKTYSWLDTGLFHVQSKSLMYCAVPKIASKTLISLMIYVYVREMVGYLNDNWTNIVVNKTQAEQFINIPKLVDQLRKNGITVPNERGSFSVTSLIETYLHVLRFEKINKTSPSLFLNPWQLSSKDIFPDVHLSSLSSISHLFSPTYTRVLFVRHPFERLASAYKERVATLAKDRIEAEPHYDNLRRSICNRYYQLNRTQRSFPTHHAYEQCIPSFEHFVQYILTNTETSMGIAEMDTHWQPYTVVCQVCRLQYNFIGKYETFNDDFTSLLRRLNVSDWNVEKRRGASGHTTRDYQQLFSSLSDDLICRLKKLYKEDLRYFNYQIESYVNRTTLVCRS